MAKVRQTFKNNIVILCEGTDTEFNYFNNAKEYIEREFPERFSSIKIVPISSETIKKKNPSKRKTRQLKEIPEYHYYCQWENSEEEYNLYKAMPTRFVRETQLYMERDGYIEGWVVFDRDVHPDHTKAFSLANTISNLHIAFSSYCFEEWLLVHFERNRQAYAYSECMISKHDSRNCGTSATSEDCHGTVCLAGALRERYINTYSKNLKGLFEAYTLERIPQKDY